MVLRPFLGVVAAIFTLALNPSTGRAKGDCLNSPPNSGFVDVFLVAGQSNATGIPDSPVGTPQVPKGVALQFYHGMVSTANDPVGNANAGSAWPSFGLRYYAETGRHAMFVPASVPASSMTIAGDFLGKGHWDESGKLFSAAISTADDAIKAAGPHSHFAGVLWDQGEADGLAIDVKFETSEQYRDALKSLIARFRSHYGKAMPFFIFQTGSTNDKDQSGLAAVRSEQVAVSKQDAESPIVFRDAVTFPSRHMMARNGAHYTQAGYNIMGDAGAAGVAAYYQRHPIYSCE